MLRILKVPMKFYDEDDAEVEKLKELGIKVDQNVVDGFMYLNIDNMATFNEGSKNNTTIHMTGGEPISINVEIQDFIKMLKEIDS